MVVCWVLEARWSSSCASCYSSYSLSFSHAICACLCTQKRIFHAAFTAINANTRSCPPLITTNCLQTLSTTPLKSLHALNLYYKEKIYSYFLDVNKKYFSNKFLFYVLHMSILYSICEPYVNRVILLVLSFLYWNSIHNFILCRSIFCTSL